MPLFDGDNLVITLDSGVTEVEVIDIYSAWKDWSLLTPTNRGYPPAFRPDGGNPLTSIINQGSYFFLRNDLGWKIKPPEEDITIYLTGNLASSHATKEAFTPTDGAFTVAILGLQPITQGVTPVMGEQLAYSSFQGAVWVDINSGLSGTGDINGEPIGNAEHPVDNIQDAVAICGMRGLPNTLKLVSDVTLDTGDDVRGFKLIGISHVKSNLIINPGALCFETNFEAFILSGTLDGDSEVVSCTIGDLNYFDGHIHNSSLNGTINLSGTLDANITHCNQYHILTTPVINVGATGQNLFMSEYTGLLEIDNLTGTSELGIGLNAGTVTVNATCTTGVVALGGTGRTVNNSGSGCYVVDTMVDGSVISNLQKLLELSRPHHTGTGNVYFWDPYNGDNTNDGRHTDRAVKTFAQAHNLAKANNHDVIVCVPGDPSGVTTSIENIVITKRYLFVRGPGRDFVMHSTNDLLPTIDIQADGIEISSVIVTNEATNTKACIESVGKFPLIKDVYIEGSTNCIHITGGEHGIIENTRIGHNSGYGIKVEGDSEHFVIRNSHIGTNAGGGVIVDFSTGHELTIDDCVIHGSTGYGVDIAANTSGVQIKSNVVMFDNSLGDVRDLGTNTFNEANMGTSVSFIKDIQGGRWKLDSNLNQMIFYAADNTTEIARFNTLDGATPAVTNVTERIRA